MARLINLQTFYTNGKLTVFERIFPEGIKRVFYIYDIEGNKRGEHRHTTTTHALICLTGGCKVYVNDSSTENTYLLNSPEQCLILEPKDWRKIFEFAENTILLCISSIKFNSDDYIKNPY